MSSFKSYFFYSAESSTFRKPEPLPAWKMFQTTHQELQKSRRLDDFPSKRSDLWQINSFSFQREKKWRLKVCEPSSSEPRKMPMVLCMTPILLLVSTWSLIFHPGEAKLGPRWYVTFRLPCHSAGAGFSVERLLFPITKGSLLDRWVCQLNWNLSNTSASSYPMGWTGIFGNGASDSVIR